MGLPRNCLGGVGVASSQEQGVVLQLEQASAEQEPCWAPAPPFSIGHKLNACNGAFLLIW